MSTTTLLTYALPGLALALLVLLLATRSRRDRATEPVRLGPRWAPPGAGDAADTAGAKDALPEDERTPILAQATGLDERTVAVVLNGWDEHLAVLGLLDLPSTHRYRVYDPYDPPVAERRDGRPVPDPVRVTRDVARREGIEEVDAALVLTALREEDDAVPPREQPQAERAQFE